MSKFRIFLLALGVLLIGIQLVPVSRTNPPAMGEVDAPAEVVAVLEESCYDCHSHETRWPWYAYVAPVSWLVAHDVDEGREHLNFSAWSQYDAEERAEKLEEIWEEVDEGKMPLDKYVWLHSNARLTNADLEVLRTWVHASEPTAPEEPTDPDQSTDPEQR
jgi:hypothetical protein